jgi:hypothetical protein
VINHSYIFKRATAPSIRSTNRASERNKPDANHGVIDGGGVDEGLSRGAAIFKKLI